MEAWRLKMEPWRVYGSVVLDSHHTDEELDADPDPGLWIRIDLMRIRIRIQHYSQLRIQIQFRIHGFDDQKLEKKFTAVKLFNIFWIENCNLGLHKGRTSYMRSLQPSKENIQHFKT
jgi:hypothetical protein